MPANAILGSKMNPIILKCSDVNCFYGRIGECILEAIQNKLGSSINLFSNDDREHINVIIKTKKVNCDHCKKNENRCSIRKLVLSKEELSKHVAVAV